jgi:hypothetical protein
VGANQGYAPPLRVRTRRSDFTLVSSAEYRVGRDPASEVALDDVVVSWRHAVLRVVDGSWVLEDVGSTGGTWLGTERISRLEITDVTIVRFGNPAEGPIMRLEPARRSAPAGAATGAVGSLPDRSPRPAEPFPGQQSGPAMPAPGYQPAPAWGYPQGAVPEPGRYLKGRCPDSVRVGAPFSLLVSVVRDGAGNAPLRAFDVGPDGQDILLVLHAPGLQVLGEQRQVVRVPFAGDSDPVMFELRSDSPGPRHLSITAWLAGTYLGELAIEVTAARYWARGDKHREIVAAIDTTAASDAVSLVVRYDAPLNTYRFEFRDEDNPAEVTSHLAYQPGPLVERMVADLDRVAKGRAGYSAAETRDYLMNAGAWLWNELIPAQLREQFWERQRRISQLTILADSDTVPWELLYPLDRGHDAGFLVEQFPVTRVLFGRRPSRSLSLSPAWFVLPDGAPPQARAEVDALLRQFRLLPPMAVPSPVPWPVPVIGALTPLLDLIRAGDFGLLHFACHNAFDPAGGSAISLDKRQFTPTQLTTAAIGQALARSAPTVFINACRSAGASASYHQLDGWARKFLDAGAGAFIGTQWAVRDTTAREFASEVYGKLRSGSPLGQAVMQARQAAASEPGDPTWLAYAIYGDPRATVR